MVKDINPKIEILFLLALCQRKDEMRKALIGSLDSMGIEGADFCDKHLPQIYQYFDAFSSHMIESPGVELLMEMEMEVASHVYASLFLIYPQWFEILPSLSEEEVRQKIEEILMEDAEEGKTIIEVIDGLSISALAKWQITVLLEKAKQHLLLVIEAVVQNLSSFEKTRDEVQDIFDMLLVPFRKNVEIEGVLQPLLAHVAPDADVIPMIALPLTLIGAGDDAIPEVYCGILMDRVLATKANMTKEELIICAKAMCEKSKMEILFSLKEKSMYSLEIAEKVGLTPATVSHHMNVLVAAGLVQLKKESGKIYYSLSSERLQKFIDSITQNLL